MRRLAGKGIWPGRTHFIHAGAVLCRWQCRHPLFFSLFFLFSFSLSQFVRSPLRLFPLSSGSTSRLSSPPQTALPSSKTLPSVTTTTGSTCLLFHSFPAHLSHLVALSSFLAASPKAASPSPKLICNSTCVLSLLPFTLLCRSLNLDELSWSTPSPPSGLDSVPPARSAAIAGTDFAAS